MKKYVSKKITFFSQRIKIKMVSKALLGCLALASIVALTHAYSGGAPVDVCEDMTPKHPAAPQKSKMPYKVTVNSEAVSAGGVVKITVSGRGGFKGFLAQVRKNNEPVGKFLVSDDDKFIKTINCGKGEQVIFERFRQFVDFLLPGLKQIFPLPAIQNAATHKNSEVKNNLSLNWQAPAGLKDQVQV